LQKAASSCCDPSVRAAVAVAIASSKVGFKLTTEIDLGIAGHHSDPQMSDSLGQARTSQANRAAFSRLIRLCQQRLSKEMTDSCECFQLLLL